jgi:hypothetical protein
VGCYVCFDVSKFINIYYKYFLLRVCGEFCYYVFEVKQNIHKKPYVNIPCYLLKKLDDNKKLRVKGTKGFYFNTAMFNMLKTK